MPSTSTFMMKRLFLLTLVLLNFTDASAQTPQAFSRQVSAGVAAVDNKTLVYFAPGDRKWHKQVITVTDVIYDVKRTDSALTPLLGVVKFTIINLQSTGVDNEEEAVRASVILNNSSYYYRVSLTFRQPDIAGPKWIFNTGVAEWFDSRDKKLSDIKITGNQEARDDGLPFDNFVAGMSR